jgi:hypothetical protein
MEGQKRKQRHDKTWLEAQAPPSNTSENSAMECHFDIAFQGSLAFRNVREKPIPRRKQIQKIYTRDKSPSLLRVYAFALCGNTSWILSSTERKRRRFSRQEMILIIIMFEE